MTAGFPGRTSTRSTHLSSVKPDGKTTYWYSTAPGRHLERLRHRHDRVRLADLHPARTRAAAGASAGFPSRAPVSTHATSVSISCSRERTIVQELAVVRVRSPGRHLLLPGPPRGSPSPKAAPRDRRGTTSAPPHPGDGSPGSASGGWAPRPCGTSPFGGAGGRRSRAAVRSARAVVAAAGAPPTSPPRWRAPARDRRSPPTAASGRSPLP